MSGSEYPSDFFLKNKDLAVDMLTLLDWIKQRIQIELNINLQVRTNKFTLINKVKKAVRNTEIEMTEVEINGEEASKQKEKGSDLRTTILLLSEATQSGYKKFEKAFLLNLSQPF